MSDGAEDGGVHRTAHVTALRNVQPSGDLCGRGDDHGHRRVRGHYALVPPGKVLCWPPGRLAVLESLVGGLLKRASITAHGELDADTDTVVFTETYTFDDGHSDTLRWTSHKMAEGQYTGLANRLEGEAVGEQAGCAFHWKYTRDTPQGDGKSFKLNFDDWFYAIDEKACIVRGSAGRAGIPFATSHVTYRRL